MFNKTYLSEILTKAAEHNTDGLRNFLTTEPSKPLIAVGSGGMAGVAQFVSLLYSAGKGLSKAMTPLEINNLSDETLSNVKVLLLSSSGHNNDIVFAAKRSLAVNPDWTACICLKSGERNKLKPLFEKAGKTNHDFRFDSDIEDGFVSCGTPLMICSLLAKTFGTKLTCDFRLREFSSRFHIETNDGEPKKADDLKNVSHFTILHSSWGMPVAHILEGKLVESGWATCNVADYRNYCHGRFIFTSNHLEDSAVVLLISPREQVLAEKIRSFLPKNTLLSIIETSEDSPAATLDLLIGVTTFFDEACKSIGINPDSPKNPGRIDKRVPMGVSFITELKNTGPLTIKR